MEYSYIALHWLQLCMVTRRHKRMFTSSANSSFTESYFSGLSQAFTLCRQMISYCSRLLKRDGKDSGRLAHL